MNERPQCFWCGYRGRKPNPLSPRCYRCQRPRMPVRIVVTEAGWRYLRKPATIAYVGQLPDGRTVHTEGERLYIGSPY